MTARGTFALLLCAAAVAVSAAIPDLFWPAVFVTAGLALAVVVDVRRAPGVSTMQARRSHDEILSVGAVNRVTIAIESRRPGVRARVVDEYPIEMVAVGAAATLRLSSQYQYEVTPRVRGQANFGNVVVRATGPWGLGYRQSRLAQPEIVKVDADVSAISTYEALTRRGQLAEIGVRAQRRRAEGTEFDRVRDAVPDDPLRFVNWRATARTGHLMTTEFQPERNQPVIICLDHGRLMGVGAGALTKLDLAINAAVLLAHVALRSGDRVGVFTFSNTVTTSVKPEMGSAHMRRILDALRPAHADEIESDYDNAMLRFSQWQRRRALVAIFTDVLDVDQSQALARQCARLSRRHLPVIITVRDPAIDDMASQPPVDSDATYARSVAGGLLADREAALAVLRAGRVDVVDADARTLSPRLIDRYLDIKRRSRV